MKGGSRLDDVVTLKDLKKALFKKLEKRGMTQDQVDNLAEYLMNFFGYDDYVTDNKLNTKDRDVFYMLEEEGILKTLSEEVMLKRGKLWRIHYWVLRKRDILRLARSKSETVPDKDEYGVVYKDLSEDLWRKHLRDNTEE
jgi:hypothetical protein